MARRNDSSRSSMQVIRSSSGLAGVLCPSDLGRAAMARNNCDRRFASRASCHRARRRGLLKAVVASTIFFCPANDQALISWAPKPCPSRAIAKSQDSERRAGPAGRADKCRHKAATSSLGAAGDSAGMTPSRQATCKAR